MKIGFYGGAGTVTGSRFLLESGRDRLLVDCGMFQGLKDLRLLNWRKPPFQAAGVDAVVLTHAHIDHSGYLPRLVREGFRGPVYCTEATRDLCEILLMDAAKIQEEDAEYANRKGFSKHHPALPLFTTRDAERALRLLEVPDGDTFEAAGFGVRFHDAGHILGSSFLEVSRLDGERPHTLVFSGDLGRYDAPMHADPAQLPPCDTLIMESTYGDREHGTEPLEDQLGRPVRETLAAGGTVLIPAFAVARAQLVLMLVRRMMDEGTLPSVPVHLDSPMAINVTYIYRGHAGTKNLELERRDVFGEWVTYHRTTEQSMALNNLHGPRVIVASSGMLTGGRVLHHLKRLLPDRKNLLVLVGYQAAGTRGRKLIEGAESVRVHGRDVPANARFVQVHGLSAHADASDLMRWVSSAKSPPGTVFLTHGEPDASSTLSRRLQAEGLKTIVPALDQVFETAGEGWKELRAPRA